MTTLETVCDLLTVTVHGRALAAEHAPAVTYVPASTPVPVTVMPTPSAPFATDVTVSVVVAMVAVTRADAT